MIFEINDGVFTVSKFHEFKHISRGLQNEKTGSADVIILS